MKIALLFGVPMENLAYTHAALEYEISLISTRPSQRPTRKYRPVSFQKMITAAALAITVMMAGIAGTVLSPLSIDATRNFSR